MIRDIEEKDFSEVNKLGKVLDSNYDVLKKSDLEKIVVYDDCGKVAGFAQFIRLYEVVELLYIVVNEDNRKKGIGTKLIDYLAKSPNVEKIILEVRESNYVGLEFYKKNGFTVLREIKNYHKNGESAFSMEKVI